MKKNSEQKQQDWELEFDELYQEDGFSTDASVLKDFIRNLLAKTKQQAREEVKRKRIECGDCLELHKKCPCQHMEGHSGGYCNYCERDIKPSI